jgi:hypothetical protein
MRRGPVPPATCAAAWFSTQLLAQACPGSNNVENGAPPHRADQHFQVLLPACRANPSLPTNERVARSREAALSLVTAGPPT